MNRFFLCLIAVVGAVALIAVNLTTAQPRSATRDEDNTLQLKKGDQYLIHASQDTVLELFVELPITEAERLNYTNLDTGKTYSLPNGANVRLQGNVVISRDAEGRSIADPRVRWRYVETIFASHSRDAR